MRIETTLIRPGGSTVEMADGTRYHFAPTETDPRHIAEVTKSDHVKRLLTIDGYQLPDDALDPADPVGKPAPEPETAGNPAGTDALTDAADAPNPLSLAPAPQIPDLDALSDAKLQALFKEKFQRAPHPKASRAKVIEKLAEHDSGIGSGETGQPQPET
jgi:hypothetical protein